MTVRFAPHRISACPCRFRGYRDDLFGSAFLAHRPARLLAARRRAEATRRSPERRLSPGTPSPARARYQFQLSLEQHVPRQRHRLQRLDAHDAGLRADADAAMDQRLALRARPRDLGTDSTPWSTPFRFDVTPPPPPTPLPSYPGVLRWTPISGADGYQVWLIDTGKIEYVRTNVLDEREFYTLPSEREVDRHGALARARRSRRPVQAARQRPAGRADRSVEPDLQLVEPADADRPHPVDRNGLRRLLERQLRTRRAHEMTPAFLWKGNQTSYGATVELYPRRGLHRQAMPEPRLHGRGRRQPCAGRRA